ncbi:MAG: hypothetical protein U0457_08950 [Candidatus Sericytochromatia bacterium]
MKKSLIALASLVLLSGCLGVNPVGNPAAGALGGLLANKPAPGNPANPAVPNMGTETLTKQDFINFVDCMEKAAANSTEPDAASLKGVISLMKTQIALVPDTAFAQQGKALKQQLDAFKSFSAKCEIAKK